MDPITAVGLAASILQVVQFSTKALTTCRELYRDGSLAEHRSTEEITKYLADTSNRLRASVDQTPKPLLHGHSDILDLSTKCSETAAKLLAELEKLKLESRGGVRQAISRSVRAIRRKNFLKEVQSKLKEYQTILDTRILAELNIHSIQQTSDFQSLDHNVRELVIALSQGRNTVAQLLADQGQAIRDHIDQRLDKHAQANHDLRVQQQFKDSLFFPAIFSRRDEIPEAHQGTCRWMFQPPHNSGTGEAHKVEVDPQKWPNFINWLEYGREIYWLNGKPGSGKSTLMRYIVSELQKNSAAKDAIADWANGTDVVAASFFFWSLGSDVLQKDLQGLLRSLLYQIANERQDLVPIMMGGGMSSVGKYDESMLPAQLHAWTEPRLCSMLQRFLLHKPSSISICFFIDGLDEFVGDEDKLVEILRLLNDTPQTKVCVSSRPEQIFRQGFSRSPQLRLQDFNHKCIEKVVADDLLPTLTECFPQEDQAIRWFVHDVIDRAQGVFLWLHLVMKDIKRGARNSDTLRELRRRLETIPDTVEGLYEHMLNSLDMVYLREAIKYFRFLMASTAQRSLPITLLQLVCAESGPWEYVRKGDLTYLGSSEFIDTCHQFETRLLTRCGGLVEIEWKRPKFANGVYSRHQSQNGPFESDVHASQEERNVSSQVREVKFIHKTVVDFLQKDTKAFFHDSDWRSGARLALVRGYLGVMSMIPIAISLDGAGSDETDHLYFVPHIERTMEVLCTISNSGAVDERDQASDFVVAAMVDHTYELIERVDASLNGTETHWFERYRAFDFGCGSDEPVPFYDVYGFAAFFGCQSYISYHNSLRDPSSMEMDYILKCTITGMRGDSLRSSDVRGFFSIIHESLRQGADPNLPLTSQFWLHHVTLILNISAWGTFLADIVDKWGTFLDDMIDETARVGSVQVDEQSSSNDEPPNSMHPSFLDWITLVQSFVAHHANVNTSIVEFSVARVGYEPVTFVREETPLSLLKRATCSSEVQFLDPVISLLTSRGAVERRRIHYIYWGYSEQLYQVPEEQSYRLLKAWSEGDDNDNGDLKRLRATFLELEASLTKLGPEHGLLVVQDNPWGEFKLRNGIE